MLTANGKSENALMLSKIEKLRDSKLNVLMTSRNVKCPAYRLQLFADLKQFDNKRIISLLLGEQSNHLTSVAEKIGETIALSLCLLPIFIR